MNDDVTSVGLGSPPTNRKQFWIKLLWIGIWLAFMSAPVKDLADGNHTPWATALGTLGLLTFVGAYLLLVFRHTTKPLDRRLLHSAIAFLGLLSVVLTLTLGTPWLVLFVYVAVSVGATLPLRTSRWLIPVVTAVLVGIGLTGDHPREVITALVFPALLGGFSMTGVRQLIRTTIELREARATVAQLAANEERLRLARDLHDLLGHSLSLITLKSELAGRMLPDHPEQAAAQVADIEQVSRQALIDVRGAVTGYRFYRPSPANSRAPVPHSPPRASRPTFRPRPPTTSPRSRRRCSPGRCGRRSPTSYGTAGPGTARSPSPRARPWTAGSSNSPSPTTASAPPARSRATASPASANASPRSTARCGPRPATPVPVKASP